MNQDFMNVNSWQEEDKNEELKEENQNDKEKEEIKNPIELG